MNEEEKNVEESLDQETLDQETQSASGESGQEINETEEQPVDEAAQWKDKCLRIYSEFENFKKRTLKERIDLIQTANETLLSRLLPVLDDFERAMSSLRESGLDKSQLEGTTLIYNKLKGVLEQNGLKPMDAIGKEFDTDFHEALTNMPVDDKSQKGKVIEVIEKGYFINDKVLRYAKVVVGN